LFVENFVDFPNKSKSSFSHALVIAINLLRDKLQIFFSYQICTVFTHENGKLVQTFSSSLKVFSTDTELKNELDALSIVVNSETLLDESLYFFLEDCVVDSTFIA